MRNILDIVKGDLRRLTSSVVAIVILMGLCIVPCLYAWFNIFSNWDPYESTATGRIAVAVTNEDKGSEMLGMHINVGEKIMDSLAGNDAIGWTFVDKSDDAVEGVRSGKYYAAVIIPEDFSSDVMSFTTGDLDHPTLSYYENVKKNAIAPKITGKAKTALKEEVDAAFIDTMGKYVSEAAAAADAVGMDPQEVFGDLGDRMDLVGERLEDCIALVSAAEGLSRASNELLQASGNLISSTEDTLGVGEDLLDAGEEALPKAANTKPVTDAVRKEAAGLTSGLDQVYSDLASVRDDMAAFNSFAGSSIEKPKKRVSDMKKSADQAAERLQKLELTGLSGRFSKISERLAGIYDQLDSLDQTNETIWAETQKSIDSILKEIDTAANEATSIADDLNGDLDSRVNEAVESAQKAIAGLRESIDGTYGNLGNLSSALEKSEKSLKKLNGGLEGTSRTLLDTQQGLRTLSAVFESLADSDALKDVNVLLSDGTEVIAENLATPMKMDTEVIYPVRNYGSLMAPFYTVLAQWVGALFAAVLISAGIRRREGEPELRLHERFFGRYRLFLMVGLAQALIVSLGDLLYVGIQCHHPAAFVLAACINGVLFSMVNFALVFALENVGLALGVIVLLLQVAGSGGTYPPEVLPGFFRVLYPFMPFRYAMDAMRECVAGMYGHTYVTCLCILLLMAAVAAAAGMLLYRPASLLNRLIRESMNKSDLMAG